MKQLAKLAVIVLLLAAVYAIFLIGFKLTSEWARRDAWETSMAYTHPSTIISDEEATRYYTRWDKASKEDQDMWRPQLKAYSEWLALRDRFRKQQQFRLLFLDSAYRRQFVRKGNADIFKTAIFPDTLEKMIVLRGWMNWRKELELTDEEYSQACDQFTKSRIGKTDVSADALFDYVSQNFDQILFDDSVTKAAKTMSAPSQ